MSDPPLRQTGRDALERLLAYLKTLPAEHPLRGWVEDNDLAAPDARIADLFHSTTAALLRRTLSVSSTDIDPSLLQALGRAYTQHITEVSWTVTANDVSSNGELPPRRSRNQAPIDLDAIYGSGQDRIHREIAVLARQKEVIQYFASLGPNAEMLRNFVVSAAHLSEAQPYLRWARDLANQFPTEWGFLNISTYANIELAAFGSPKDRYGHLHQALQQYIGEDSLVIDSRTGSRIGASFEYLPRILECAARFPWREISSEQQADLTSLLEAAMGGSIANHPYGILGSLHYLPISDRAKAHLAVAALASVYMTSHPEATDLPRYLHDLAAEIGETDPPRNEGRRHISNYLLLEAEDLFTSISEAERIEYQKQIGGLVGVAELAANVLSETSFNWKASWDFEYPRRADFVFNRAMFGLMRDADLETALNIASVAIRYNMTSHHPEDSLKFLQLVCERTLDDVSQVSFDTRVCGALELLEAVDTKSPQFEAGIFYAAVETVYVGAKRISKHGAVVTVIADGRIEAIDRLASRMVKTGDKEAKELLVRLVTNTSDRDEALIAAAAMWQLRDVTGAKELLASVEMPALESDDFRQMQSESKQFTTFDQLNQSGQRDAFFGFVDQVAQSVQALPQRSNSNELGL